MSLVNSEWKQQWQCHSAYVVRCQMPKTQRTACEQWCQSRRSTHQAFWRWQRGFDMAHLLLYCAVYIVKFIAF